MKKHNQTAKVLLSVCMGIAMIFIMNIVLTTHSVFTSQVNSTLLEPAELNGETTTTTANATHIVLVHGSFGDGSVWSKVIPVLQNAGHRVTAVQLPLQSLTEDVAVVERAIERIGDPTILVGHSYGGAVITNAGYNNSNVTGLVYLAAYAPAQGESLLDLGNNTADLPENLFTIDNEGFMLMNPDLSMNGSLKMLT